jgi:hypothetical protein
LCMKKVIQGTKSRRWGCLGCKKMHAGSQLSGSWGVAQLTAARCEKSALLYVLVLGCDESLSLPQRTCCCPICSLPGSRPPRARLAAPFSLLSPLFSSSSSTELQAAHSTTHMTETGTSSSKQVILSEQADKRAWCDPTPPKLVVGLQQERVQATRARDRTPPQCSGRVVWGSSVCVKQTHTHSSSSFSTWVSVSPADARTTQHVHTRTHTEQCLQPLQKAAQPGGQPSTTHRQHSAPHTHSTRGVSPTLGFCWMRPRRARAPSSTHIHTHSLHSAHTPSHTPAVGTCSARQPACRHSANIPNTTCAHTPSCHPKPRASWAFAEMRGLQGCELLLLPLLLHSLLRQGM